MKVRDTTMTTYDIETLPYEGVSKNYERYERIDLIIYDFVEDELGTIGKPNNGLLRHSAGLPSSSLARLQSLPEGKAEILGCPKLSGHPRLFGYALHCTRL